MCGLAGLALRPGATAPAGAMDAMVAALAHRGPDGAGQHEAGGVAIAHTRLSIIDLVTGDQPLFAGGAALVANGEIYNYRELREQNQLRCTTQSDCEPPLHLYRRDGPGFVNALRGMYAIALHDRPARRLVLARDPFGIKPLYIAEIAQGIAFASEPQALIAGGFVTPQIRPEARDELLQLQFTTGAETIFQGIRRLLPGESLSIADGMIIDRQRRMALPEGPPEVISEEAALARLDAALARNFSASWGVWQPMLRVGWRREFANPARPLSVRFVSDGSATPIRFDTDDADRAWGEAGLGAVFVFTGGHSAYFELRQRFGHDFLQERLFSIGWRMELP